MSTENGTPGASGGCADILLILCDQFRFDALSFMGHPVVETPNLDTLAAQGAFFDAAYSPAPSCIPARACLFTGLPPGSTGFLGYEDGHDWNFPDMLPEVLRNHGYQTHCVGKTHFFPQNRHCGFEGIDSYECWQRLTPWYTDDYADWVSQCSGGALDEKMAGLDDNGWNAAPSALPTELHNNTWVVTKGLDFLRRRDRTRPYFLNLSFHRPHPPLDPPAGYYERYQSRICDKPHTGGWDFIHDKPVTSLRAWEGRLPEKQLAQMRLAYYAQIAHIDSQIGRLLRTLQSLHDTPDVIIFTSDHGDMLGDHHMLRKACAYEGSARVPLIIWEKKRPIEKRIPDTVTLCDLYPAILHYAKIPGYEKPEAENPVPLFQGGNKLHRSWIHGEHSACYSETGAMQFLTDGRTKYIWFTSNGREQLFNLEADPYECRDLSADPAWQKLLSVWRGRLAEYLATRPQDGLSDGKHLIPGLLPAVRPSIFRPKG